jgi:3-deoxy-D-arabino-heptulosonate 7-phosphate (DAHP) synthase
MHDTWTIKKAKETGGANGQPKGVLPLVKRTGEGTIIWVRNIPIGGEEAVVIAGPCSVETREQVTDTAFAVKACGAAILRGGAYKPAHRHMIFRDLA